MSDSTWLLVGVVLLGGCSRGQTYDSNQVRTIKDASGTNVQHLMLPIRGKPFASGAQWAYDQLVASQPGGDVEEIVVDPASVVVVASQVGYGQGIFIMAGRARVILVRGEGEFDAHFREVLEGGCTDDRVLSSCATCFLPAVSAYTIPLENWKQTIASANRATANDYITSELSIYLLVQQITAAGSVDMAKLSDWKQANQIAWDHLSGVPIGWGA
jgi:hypothetical protein